MIIHIEVLRLAQLLGSQTSKKNSLSRTVLPGSMDVGSCSPFRRSSDHGAIVLAGKEGRKLPLGKLQTEIQS